MPIPIMPVNIHRLDNERSMVPQADYGIDVSNLPFAIEKKSKNKDLVKVSSFEAGVLFRLWRDAGDINEDEFLIPSSVSNNDVLRLKASGLISGDMDKLKFTQRGRDVIETMVLAEENSFDKKAKSKGFQEILADNASKLEKGPRLALGRKPS